MRSIIFVLAGMMVACEDSGSVSVEDKTIDETTDTDGDGIADVDDAFPEDANESVDTDQDGVGDNADAFPEDPAETADSDEDGVGDNADEFPNDPTESVDSDQDGLGDNEEAELGTDPNNADSDGDGLDDADELDQGTNPNNADSDNDGLTDSEELDQGTDPNNLDSDGDGATDGQEITEGTDPNDATSGGADPVVPLAGMWNLDNITIGQDSCGINGLLTMSGYSAAEVFPTEFTIGNTTSSSFEGSLQGQTATCLVTGNTFSCGSLNLVEPFEVASMNVEFELGFGISLTGSTIDEENINILMSANLASCTDTDGFSCMLLEGFVSLPCDAEVSAEGSLQ